MSQRVTQQELERELRKFVDGAITMNISDIARSRHWGWNRAQELVKKADIPVIASGRAKEFLVKHVAKAMIQEMNLLDD